MFHDKNVVVRYVLFYETGSSNVVYTNNANAIELQFSEILDARRLRLSHETKTLQAD